MIVFSRVSAKAPFLFCVFFSRISAKFLYLIFFFFFFYFLVGVFGGCFCAFYFYFFVFRALARFFLGVIFRDEPSKAGNFRSGGHRKRLLVTAVFAKICPSSMGRPNFASLERSRDEQSQTTLHCNCMPRLQPLVKGR